MSGDAYCVERHGDVCDVTIYDNVQTFRHEAGTEYDFEAYVLPGVPWTPDLEDNIREHYQAWRAHAAAFTAQRDAMLAIIDQAAASAAWGAYGGERTK